MMPVAGRPSSNPGPRIHPIFKRKSCHTGWDLAAPTGTPSLRQITDPWPPSVEVGRMATP